MIMANMTMIILILEPLAVKVSCNLVSNRAVFQSAHTLEGRKLLEFVQCTSIRAKLVNLTAKSYWLDCGRQLGQLATLFLGSEIPTVLLNFGVGA